MSFHVLPWLADVGMAITCARHADFLNKRDRLRRRGARRHWLQWLEWRDAQFSGDYPATATLAIADNPQMRWLVSPPSWKALHRIVGYEQRDDGEEYVGVNGGRAACGLVRNFRMPGFVSRLYLKRCKACCNKLGVPRGEGTPWNQGLDA